MIHQYMLRIILIFILYNFSLCSVIKGDGNGRGATNGNGIEIIPNVVNTDNYHGTCNVYSDCPALSCIVYERCCYEGYCICSTTCREDKCKGKKKKQFNEKDENKFNRFFGDIFAPIYNNNILNYINEKIKKEQKDADDKVEQYIKELKLNKTENS